MNEVMDTANSNKINIYYQDTDSMHLELEDVSRLSDLYDEKYNRNLIGNNMGQFHNDLELNGRDAKSIECIILGKKCYLDVLENDKKERGYHIRMKGVGSKCLIANLSENQTPIDVYIDLLKNKKVKFDLLKSGVKFETRIGEYVSTKDKFEREIRFLGKYKKIK
jgi:hypothetical protein